jgi:hypothetical protein
MKFFIKTLVLLGCAALLFGILAFDVIPYRIVLPLMSPAQRATIDRSIFELEWIDRGIDSIEAGCLLLAAALLAFLFSQRASKRLTADD